MHSSRRSFLRKLGMGSAVGSLLDCTLSAVPVHFGPTTTGEFDHTVRLNHNENAYGPSTAVREAIQLAISQTNRYPCVECDGLVERIAALHRVKPEQVILGCGSTEILRAAACALLGVGTQLVQASPTFEAIEGYARATGATVASLPLDGQYSHDLGAMLRSSQQMTSLVYICSPNNPTASLTPRGDIETFIAKSPKNSSILIDEAYHHYAGLSGYQSFLGYAVHDERIIVCRTFSKVYGLAGLRVGYGVAHASTIKKIRPHLTANSVNEVALSAALAAIQDEGGLQNSVKRNSDDRQEFFSQAVSRMMKPIDSHANFVLMNAHHPAEDVIRHFQKNNILIGSHIPALHTYIRVSLGLPAEMRAFWQVWDASPFATAMSH